MGDMRDELLTLAMAVADGEASAAEQRRLEAELARDPHSDYNPRDSAGVH